MSILLFGDSIIAGYGLSQQDSLSVQLETFFAQKGLDIKVINGGVSGDTTSGGRGRLEWTLKQSQPDFVFIALGGNDLLRGFQPSLTRENIEAMLSMLKDKKVNVILSSVSAPANLGPEYMLNFNKIYPDLARKYKVQLYPFLLEKVFENKNFMQNDGIHPTAEGIKVIASDMGIYLLDHINLQDF